MQYTYRAIQFRSSIYRDDTCFSSTLPYMITVPYKTVRIISCEATPENSHFEHTYTYQNGVHDAPHNTEYHTSRDGTQQNHSHSARCGSIQHRQTVFFPFKHCITS